MFRGAASSCTFSCPPVQHKSKETAGLAAAGSYGNAPPPRRQSSRFTTGGPATGAERIPPGPENRLYSKTSLAWRRLTTLTSGPTEAMWPEEGASEARWLCGH
ncbi:hypothetical protein EYF80_030054 [Liparis tanakae]|uniref:Uncharacterized protein n=1 Tax=Liparis tanakae TaxID=230148 RepID=A0A4Z2H3L0_9TELE|nr:hypothetical protein EYF80_030054 [Liparis tanakae]